MGLSCKKTTFLLALTVLVLLCAVFPVGDTDVFWHLAAGNLILKAGIPTTNTFSFTYPDHPWHNTYWLFEVVASLVHRVAGFDGLIALNVLVVLVTVLLLTDCVWRLTGGCSWLHLVPFAYWLHFSRFRFTTRPQLLTFLFLALLINVLFRPRTRATALLLPVVAVVWANSHAGFVFGVVLVLLLLLARLIDALRTGRDPEARRRLRDAAIAAALFIPFTLINNNVFYPFTYMFLHLSAPAGLAIDELQRATFSWRETFFIFTAMFLAGLPFIPRIYRSQALAANLPFFLLAFTSVRIIPKAGIVALPFLCLAIEGLLRRFQPRTSLKVLSGLALCLPLAVYAPRDFRELPPALGLDGRKLPVGATRFVRDAGLTGNFYNDFDDGGYLIYSLYPERRVFQDGRIPDYPPAFFREIFSTMDAVNWGAIMDRFHVDFAIVRRRGSDARSNFAPFFTKLGWSMVYLDGNSVVFARDSPANREVTRRYAYRVLTPVLDKTRLSSTVATSPQALLGDLLRLDPAGLRDPWEFLYYGHSLYRLGRSDDALRFLLAGKRRYPALPEYDYPLALIARDRGDQNLARRSLDRVIATTTDPDLRGAALQTRASLR